jgi:hypothetical protein
MTEPQELHIDDYQTERTLLNNYLKHQVSSTVPGSSHSRGPRPLEVVPT